MEIKMNGVSLIVDHITVLQGSGKWLDINGEVFDIYNIKLPMLADGKHITVHSKDMDDVVENRSYDDGKILEFICEKIEHWKV